MGLTYANLLIKNARTQAEIEVRTLVDSGALHLCIPKHIAIQLGFDLETAQHRDVIVADGSELSVPYVGPFVLQFQNRQCFSGALVLGSEVLLGAIPMEDMDLVVIPGKRELSVNPLSPHVASSIAKLVSLPFPPPAFQWHGTTFFPLH